MAVEITDLEKMVKDHAKDFLDSSEKKHADLDNPVINWNHMHVLYGETKYIKQEQPPKPTAHVLFSANFANNTPKPQVYSLRTERRTRSACNITMTRFFSYGAGINLKLTPPNPIIEANAGFQANISQNKGISQTFEQELAWSVDNQISVPPGYQTKAELVINEDSYSGDFEVPTTFEGKIMVTYEEKKTRDHISTVVDNVAKILNNKQGFQKDNLGRPTFMVKGVCKCRFGIEQNVKLTESPLPPDVISES